MATNGVNANGLYDTSGTDPFAALLTNFLGNSTDKDTNSNQVTDSNKTGTSNSNTSSTTNANSTGTNNSDTTNYNNSLTSNRTTGTTNTNSIANTRSVSDSSTTGGRSWSQSEQTSADIGGLQEILKRQLAGITPEMLAAIFSEGSKAAPQMLTAQSNALGARAGNNTPVAAALNMLNGQLTAKAADVNLQMLRDAMTSANSIGNFTKKVNTAGSESSFSNTHTVNNSSTDTSTTQLMDQLVNGITASKGGSTTLGTTTNNATTNTNQTNATNTTDTGHQTVKAQETVQSQSTINTNIAKGLAGLAATGIGINELLKQATGKGFVGNAQDLINALRGTVSPATIQKWMDEGTFSTTPGGSDGFEFGNDPIVTIDNPGFDTQTTIDEGTFLDTPGGSDGFEFGVEDVFEFADGGLFDVTKLIGDSPDNKQNQGIGLLLSALLGGLNSSSANKSTDKATDKPTRDGNLEKIDKVDPKKVVTSTHEVRGTGDAGADDYHQESDAKMGDFTPMYRQKSSQGNMGDGGGDVENTDEITGYLRGVGRVGNALTQDIYDADGNFQKREVEKPDFISRAIETVIPMLASAFIPGAGMVMGAGTAIDAAERGDIGGVLKGAIGAYNGAGKIPMADGGSVEDATGPDNDDPIETMMASLGVTKTPQGVHLDSAAMKRLLKSLGGETDKEEAAEEMADGGQIKGPGTGTSDSVQASGPNGENIKLSNGEFIVPADVVSQLGKHFFDHLINKYHTPVN